MVWGEKNSAVEALLLQRWLQEMAPAQCLLLPQGFCCAFPLAGIKENGVPITGFMDLLSIRKDITPNRDSGFL